MIISNKPRFVIKKNLQKSKNTGVYFSDLMTKEVLDEVCYKVTGENDYSVDFVDNEAEQGRTVTSIFTTIRSRTTTVNGVDYRHFLPAIDQVSSFKATANGATLKSYIDRAFNTSVNVQGECRTSYQASASTSTRCQIFTSSWSGNDGLTNSNQPVTDCIQLV